MKKRNDNSSSSARRKTILSPDDPQEPGVPTPVAGSRAPDQLTARRRRENRRKAAAKDRAGSYLEERRPEHYSG